jgi:hypothetical protein
MLCHRALVLAPLFSRLIVSLSLLMMTMMLGALSCAADTPPSWNSATQGAFVTALCADHHGNTYAATEGNGVWRWNGSTWTQFTTQNTKDGLGSDDVYALCADAQGRLWAGTLHGLSVFNGNTWENYGPLEGLGGWRVFALAVSPKDGDIWAATEGGLTRYSLHHHIWAQYSRTNGLPSDAVACLAFAPGGTLYAGMQADGIAIASQRTDYRIWRTVPGPAVPPPSPGGDGLPSALTNALLVARDGTVYCATDDGLARSPNGGRTWRFLRGANWQDMVKGEGNGLAPVATDTRGKLLAEDYVTALAEDEAGYLYIGHRQKGLGIYDEEMALGVTPPGSYGGYVEALLPVGDGRVLLGTYGDGLVSQVLPDAPTTVSITASVPALLPAVAKTYPSLPLPAVPPTLSQLNALLKTVSAVPPAPHEFRPHVVALDDDWATEGDWLGRYGRYWACLCAICSPSDYVWGAGWEQVQYVSQMGPDHDPGDSLRYWVQWLYTSDPRVLEMPPTYLDSRIKRGLTTAALNRREAEQDDHAEEYPTTRDALGDYETVTVPPGLYVLSLYEMNKDGHTAYNRDRDYRLSVRPHLASDLADIGDFTQEPEWAHGRVSEFWEGVWKRFLVRGPMTLDVKVGRNHSLNTIVQAVTLDLVDETPPPYFGTVDQWQDAQAQDTRLWRTRLTECSSPIPFHPARTESQAADRLLAALSQAQTINSTWWAKNARCAYLPLMRWYASQVPPPAPAPTSFVTLLLWSAIQPFQPDSALWRHFGTCDYQLGLYPQWEECLRQANLTPARDIEKALRWDGVSDAGQDLQVVMAYLATHTTYTKNERELSNIRIGLANTTGLANTKRSEGRPITWRGRSRGIAGLMRVWGRL